MSEDTRTISRAVIAGYDRQLGPLYAAAKDAEREYETLRDEARNLFRAFFETPRRTATEHAAGHARYEAVRAKRDLADAVYLEATQRYLDVYNLRRSALTALGEVGP